MLAPTKPKPRVAQIISQICTAPATLKIQRRNSFIAPPCLRSRIYSTVTGYDSD